MKRYIFFLFLGFFMGIILLHGGYGCASSRKALSPDRTEESKYEAEYALGQCLALEAFREYGLPVKDEKLQEYVNLVGNALVRTLPTSRRDFSFTVIKSPFCGSFAFPGGIIFITSTLIESLNSEAELAGVLAHDIAHITKGHALRSVDKTKLAHDNSDSNFAGIIAQLKALIFKNGYSDGDQFVADLSAMDLAYRTGYNPEVWIKALTLCDRTKTTDERVARCKEQLKNYPDSSTLVENRKRFVEVIKKEK